MIDHVSVPVSDLQKSADFYTKILDPLGLSPLTKRPTTWGFGKRYPEFWLNVREGLLRAPDTSGHHICLRGPSIQSIENFYRMALESGGTCGGEPGERQGAMTLYFGAFILDPDGNRIEAVTFPPKTDFQKPTGITVFPKN